MRRSFFLSDPFCEYPQVEDKRLHITATLMVVKGRDDISD